MLELLSSKGDGFVEKNVEKPPWFNPLAAKVKHFNIAWKLILGFSQLRPILRHFLLSSPQTTTMRVHANLAHCDVPPSRGFVDQVIPLGQIAFSTFILFYLSQHLFHKRFLSFNVFKGSKHTSPELMQLRPDFSWNASDGISPPCPARLRFQYPWYMPAGACTWKSCLGLGRITVSKSQKMIFRKGTWKARSSVNTYQCRLNRVLSAASWSTMPKGIRHWGSSCTCKARFGPRAILAVCFQIVRDAAQAAVHSQKL